jgi:hypothetical protein
MAQSADTGLRVRFEALGRSTINVSEWEIDSHYLEDADGFSFTLFEQDRALLRGLKWQPVELIVNGASQCFGRIDRTRRGDSAYKVECIGRDYLADLIASDVDPSVAAKSGDDVGLALARAMAPVGITGILDDADSPVTDIRLGKPRKKGSGRKSKKSRKVEDYKPTDGEKILAYCKRIAAREGATIQPGPDRTAITLDVPDFSRESTFSLRRTDDPTSSAGNNVLSGEAIEDLTEMPTYVLFTGTAGKSGKLGSGLKAEFSMPDYVGISIGGRSLLPQLQEIVDLGVNNRRKPDAPTLAANKVYRLLTHRDREARTQEQVDNAAAREVAERLKDSLIYTATVQGHVDPKSGCVWSVGAMVDVDDSIAEVHEQLWIAKRTLKFGAEGATTYLECWRPRSFVIGTDE